MEENAKIEQNLNEDQLQKITGGCKYCAADEEKANHFGAKAQNSANLAQAARILDQPEVAAKHDLASKLYSGVSQMYQDRIVKRAKIRHVIWGEQ